MHLHDAMHRDHDKDFRCVAAFPAGALESAVLRVWRADHWGHLEVDTILPSKAAKREVHVIIHRGHMRALRAPDLEAAKAVRNWALNGRTLRELPTMGWELYLASE